MPRVRLDVLVSEHGLAESRQRAQALIRAGQILVDDVVVDKPGTKVSDAAALRVKGERIPYVSRGGLKLAAGLEAFGVVPAGRTCADLGSSTGGFTDCLLQAGAKKVFAIDVGYNQLAWKLRKDPRVVVMERTNARHLEALPEPVSLLVGDLSFISLTKVLPAIRRLSTPGGECVLLIKPQFEAGPGGVSKGGVVRDSAVRDRAIADVVTAAEDAGFLCKGTVPSPLPGAKKGNVEELVHLVLPEAS